MGSLHIKCYCLWISTFFLVVYSGTIENNSIEELQKQIVELKLQVNHLREKVETSLENSGSNALYYSAIITIVCTIFFTLPLAALFTYIQNILFYKWEKRQNILELKEKIEETKLEIELRTDLIKELRHLEKLDLEIEVVRQTQMTLLPELRQKSFKV